MAYATETRAAGGSFFQKVSDALGYVADRYARYLTYRETMAELSALSDRDLADLGLSRSDLHRVAVQAAYSNK